MVRDVNLLVDDRSTFERKKLKWPKLGNSVAEYGCDDLLKNLNSLFISNVLCKRLAVFPTGAWKHHDTHKDAY